MSEFETSGNIAMAQTNEQRPWSDANVTPDIWRLYALRLGRDTYPGGGKLMFEGSFKDAHDFLDFLERMPMNTPGMEAIKKIQNPQPYIVRVVGPLVTVKLGNEKTCLNLSFNGEK